MDYWKFLGGSKITMEIDPKRENSCKTLPLSLSLSLVQSPIASACGSGLRSLCICLPIVIITAGVSSERPNEH